mgnify:FL=1
MITLLWQLFSTFFVIGLFNFGGGGAMLSLIQAQVVTEHGWLTEKAFTDIVAISQSTPGPIGINCATYVGFQVLHDEGYSNLAAILGSASTTLAIVLPSFLVFFAIIRIFNRFHQHPVFVSVMGALRPAVAGMIGAAALVLIFGISWAGGGLSMHILQDNFPDWKAWALFAASFLLCYTKKTGPITLLVASGVLGLLIY